MAQVNAIVFCRGCKQIIARVPYHDVPYEITCPSCNETRKVHWQKKWNGDARDLKYRITAAHERSKTAVYIQLFCAIRRINA